MQRYFLGALLWLIPLISFGKTPIFGNPEVEIDHMYAYVKRHNPDFKREVAAAFYNVGRRYGIRGDIAMCQAIIETGWFRFGVTAMIQHLYAYACRGSLPSGERKIDPRFDYVSRGSAPTWEKLAGRWAMNPRYGSNILRIYSGLASKASSGRKIQFIEVDIPDHLLDDDGIDYGDLDYVHDVESTSATVTDDDLFN